MSKKDKNCSPCLPDRLGKVGGQAVLEGVMMKAGNRMTTTCRKPDGSLVVTDDNFVSAREKHKILDLPLIRGVVSFIESMTMSFKTLGASADALGLEEEEPSKFEKWLSEKLKIKATDLVMILSLILGLGLSAVLFIFLPIWVTSGINWLLESLFCEEMGKFATSLVEGVIKVGIFVGYLVGVSFMPDIKRTFMYHGAEHKSIACFEAGEELTPENAKKYTRLHPRCGTSFMFFMILLGIFAGFILKTVLPEDDDLQWLYPIVRLAVLPILMGLGYEFIRFAGKHPNAVTRALSAPGLWMQKITTKEPTDDMLECAIISLKCALRDDYPEFMEFYNEKPWEEKEELQNSDAEPQDKNITAENPDGDTAEANSDIENTDTGVAEIAPEAENADANVAEIAPETENTDTNVAEVALNTESAEEKEPELSVSDSEADSSVNDTENDI